MTKLISTRGAEFLLTAWCHGGAGRGDADLRQGAHNRYFHHRRRADVS